MNNPGYQPQFAFPSQQTTGNHPPTQTYNKNNSTVQQTDTSGTTDRTINTTSGGENTSSSGVDNVYNTIDDYAPSGTPSTVL